MNANATDLQPSSARTMWAWVIATFFGIGRLGPGPGTWASVATVLLWSIAARTLPFSRPLVAIAIAVIVLAVGIPASTRVARESAVHDPGFVVIDEVAGQMLPLIIAPVVWKYLLLSLILFRCFDILKPPPLRALERLPEGVGIMLDDIGAGIYSLVVLAVIMKLWPAL